MTLVITRDDASRLGFDLDAAVADFIHRLEAHRGSAGTPAPRAHPVVESAVVRVPATPLGADEARAEISRSICGGLAEEYRRHAAAARADLAERRRSVTVVQRAVAKLSGDPMLEQDRAVARLESAANDLASGTLPRELAHLVPSNPPPVASGPDTWVADYRIV